MMRNNRFIELILCLALLALIIGCSKRHDKNSVQAVKSIEKSENNQSFQDVTIYEAALNGKSDVVSELLQKGFDANKADQDGRTALMYAAYNGHTEVVKILLEHKASVDMPDSSGRTALMFAASGPFPETVKILLDHHANPNIVDFQDHFTALMFAANEGQKETVKTLLEGKADPSMKDIDGETALNFALKNGHTEVAALLKARN
jgi:uncharacterized protein